MEDIKLLFTSNLWGKLACSSSSLLLLRLLSSLLGKNIKVSSANSCFKQFRKSSSKSSNKSTSRSISRSNNISSIIPNVTDDDDDGSDNNYNSNYQRVNRNSIHL